MKKIAVLYRIEENEQVIVNLIDIADITFRDHEDHDVVVQMDDGTVHECDYLEIERA
jgi:hypothetical protein